MHLREQILVTFQRVLPLLVNLNNLSLTNVIFAIVLIGLVGMLLDLMFAKFQRWVTYVE